MFTTACFALHRGANPSICCKTSALRPSLQHAVCLTPHKFGSNRRNGLFATDASAGGGALPSFNDDAAEVANLEIATAELDAKLSALGANLSQVEESNMADGSTLDALRSELGQLQGGWRSKQAQLQALVDLLAQLRGSSGDVVVLQAQVQRAQAKVDNMLLLLQRRELLLGDLRARLRELEQEAPQQQELVGSVAASASMGAPGASAPASAPSWPAGRLAVRRGPTLSPTLSPGGGDAWPQQDAGRIGSPADKAGVSSNHPGELAGKALETPGLVMAAGAMAAAGVAARAYKSFNATVPEQHRPAANAALLVVVAVALAALAGV